METLFVFLMLASVVGLIVGLTKPETVHLNSRGKVGLFFGGAIVIFIILTGAGSTTQTQSTPITATATVSTTTSNTSPVATTSTSTPIVQPVTQTPSVTKKPVAVQTTQPVVSTPVQTPTPVIAPAPQAPAPFTISGTGQTASRQFTLQQGLAIFTMNYSGAGNFIVDLLDSSGNEVANLANQIGNYSGSQAVQIPGTGSYIFNVQAGSATESGSWSITTSQPIPTNVSSVTTLTGTGDKATQFFSLSSGLHTFNMSYNGSGNFIVSLLDQNGNEVQGLENVIGSFTGSTAVGIDASGPYLLNVTAGSANSAGNWSISIQ